MTLAETLMAFVGRMRQSREPNKLKIDPDGVLQGSGSLKFYQPEVVTRPEEKQGANAAATAIKRATATAGKNQSPALARALSIPCPDPTAEDRDRDRHQGHGTAMARQERWTDIAELMEEADTERKKTSGGMPIAELLSYGARADVVSAAEHALISGKPDHDAPLLDGIEALEEVLAEFPDNPWIATIVASAHMDIGWAWRGTGWEAEVRAQNKAAFEAHFDRAADILDQFDAVELNAPILAAAKCALVAGMKVRSDQLVKAYDTYIDLDPENARALRAFGAHLLPRWHGSYEQLELNARRVSGRHFEVWGSGGYALVMLDAISSDAEACKRLDLEFFVEGLRDILDRCRDQHTVNLLAAYCANTMGNSSTGDDEADFIRARIADSAEWIVRGKLKELHPMIWAHAARGFDNALRVRCAERFAASGYADALRVITDIYRGEASRQMRQNFSANFSERQPQTA